MAEWLPAVTQAGFVTAVAVLLRSALIWVVTLWSLRADDKGRKHALTLIRLLRPTLRWMHERPSDPAQRDEPAERKDPPSLTPP